jgi:hypothetical protein
VPCRSTTTSSSPQPPTNMSLRPRPTSTCGGKQSDTSIRLTIWVSEEPATSGGSSSAVAGGNHFLCVDVESQRLQIYSDDGHGMHAIRGCGTLSTWSLRSPHRSAQSLQGLILTTCSEAATVGRGRRVACGGGFCVWRAGVRFRDAGKHDDVRWSVEGDGARKPGHTKLSYYRLIVVEKRL